MPDDPTPDTEYTYRLELVELSRDVATFTYLDAPKPVADDTHLLLNRPSWETLGRPVEVHVTIRPGMHL